MTETGLTAITELRKTAWVVPSEDGGHETDALGNFYFSKPIAMSLGRALRSVPVCLTSGGLKRVVTGYTS